EGRARQEERLTALMVRPMRGEVRLRRGATGRLSLLRRLSGSGEDCLLRGRCALHDSSPTVRMIVAHDSGA
ncbi:MAG: hypothetical protein IKC90_04385, partial [Akkermansia sp.]|nr:hypothetical protein [Akkermansia sp.]